MQRWRRSTESPPSPAREPRNATPAQSPLDDVSLVLLVVAAFAGLARISIAPAFVWQAGIGLRPAGGVVAAAMPLIVASAGLLLRARLDRSAVPAAIGVLGLSGVAMAIAGPRAASQQAMVLAALALAAAAIAALATPRARGASVGRLLFGVVELPWSWPDRGAIAQGFGLAAFPLGLLAALADLLWFFDRSANRGLAIAAAVTLALTCALLFATRAADTLRVRGRAAVLWALAAAVALAAIANRIDRPLPPAVIARNLSIIGVALWLLARGLARAGDWLEEKLDAPDERRRALSPDSARRRRRAGIAAAHRCAGAGGLPDLSRPVDRAAADVPGPGGAGVAAGAIGARAVVGLGRDAALRRGRGVDRRAAWSARPAARARRGRRALDSRGHGAGDGRGRSLRPVRRMGRAAGALPRDAARARRRGGRCSPAWRRSSIRIAATGRAITRALWRDGDPARGLGAGRCISRRRRRPACC